MAGKYDAVIDELNTKIDKLIKLYKLILIKMIKCDIFVWTARINLIDETFF